jgi:hypothetical protein
LFILIEAPGSTQNTSLQWPKENVISFPIPEMVEHGGSGEYDPHK